MKLWILKPVGAAMLLILLLGLAVYWSGLTGEFLGDDLQQIVQNPVIQSLDNARLFFEGSTFYNGQGIVPLTGAYYRPLMVATFALIYHFFGSQAVAFHLVQLGLHMMVAGLLFLVFRYFFSWKLALGLALVFLVHPVNSQGVYSIAAMQEPLYMSFGLLAVWSLVRFKTARWLVLTVLALFLAMLAKETAALFIAVVVWYSWRFDRRRIVWLLVGVGVVIAAYLTLKLSAVGLVPVVHNAPIAELSLADRLLHVPAMLLFYLRVLIFPVSLAHAYYWTIPGPTVKEFWLPLLLCLVMGLAVIWGAWRGWRQLKGCDRRVFELFGLWTVLGIGLHMQLVGLDLTVSETWLYFPLVGILGIVGLALTKLRRPSWLTPRLSVVILAFGLLLLGGRTLARGFDWHDQSTLIYRDIAVSPADYSAESFIALDLAREGELMKARVHANRSIALYPNYSAYNTLGLILVGMGDYPGAEAAYHKAIRLGNFYVAYENLAVLYVRYGDPGANEKFILRALRLFPEDAKLWLYLAILRHNSGNPTGAKKAIALAHQYGQSRDIAFIYAKLMADEPFTINFTDRPE